MMGLGKPQLRAKFEVAGFICYGNIRDMFQSLLELQFDHCSCIDKFVFDTTFS